MERNAGKFIDRRDAGRQLADVLRQDPGQRPVVVALPRGGVPVAYEVARACGAPLDVCVVRKLGVPWQPELGMGAVAEGGHLFLSQETVTSLGLSDAEVARVVEKEREEVAARVRRFRGGHERVPVAGRTVLLIDDGIATGGTALAAIAATRAEAPAEIVLGVPVAAAETVLELAPAVDRIVALLQPRALYAIGMWYEDFSQVPDEEVVALLARSRREQARRG